MTKGPEAFRTISEVAEELDVAKHVLRFWETKFTHVKPMKRGGGRRYYRPEDVELLRGIRTLLHDEGYSIRGLQRVFRQHGVNYIKSYPLTAADDQNSGRSAGGRVPDIAGEAAEHAREAAMQRAKTPAKTPTKTPAKTPAKPPRLAAAARIHRNEAAEAQVGATAHVPAPGLSAAQRQTLECALAELEECRQLLASAAF